MEGFGPASLVIWISGVGGCMRPSSMSELDGMCKVWTNWGGGVP